MPKYRRYSEDVKDLIIRTRNPNLFPELGIPRTTALYWIERSGKTRKLSAAKSTRDSQILRVANELNKETYKLSVLSKVLREDLRNKGREGRKAIVDMIDKGKAEYGINYTQFCRILGIHVATLKDWRIDIHGCNWKFKKCEVITTNNLLDREKETILRLLRDERFRHYSLKSLCYYGKRHRLVYASVTTWYKYMKLNGIDRSRNKRKKTRGGKGPFAKRPNEVWHIDVTQFKLRGGRKLYLQAIVDNFSRFIVDFEFSDKISGNMTSNLLKRAFSKYDVKYLLSDAGTENNNRDVRKVVLGKGIRYLIAKRETCWSNSMVEASFAAIKRRRHDFLSETVPEIVIAELTETIREINYVIPHSTLAGGTPYEVYARAWKKEDIDKMEEEHELMMLERLADQSDCPCGM